MWTEDSGNLEIMCFRYFNGVDNNNMDIDIYRVSLVSKVEGVEIENFGVTKCVPSSLQQSNSVTKKETGYDYVIQFRHRDGTCYLRTYFTKNTDFLATIQRGNVKRIACPKELVRH